MKIHTVWATRKDTPEDPELVVAWDDYSVDGNPEGYEEDVKKSLASWGTDLDQHRFIVLDVPDDLLDQAFGVPTIPVSVRTPKPEPTSLPSLEKFTLEHSTEVMVNVHSETACAGEHCTMHNRSMHSMRAFPQHWRGDRGIMERICPHGVGHPDPDSPWAKDSAEWIHGCDGCCQPR